MEMRLSPFLAGLLLASGLSASHHLDYQDEMKRAQALHKLNDRAPALKAMGATALYLFGSTARDEAADSSDIDLFIDYDGTTRFSLISLLKIKHFLEDEIGASIDIATRDSLHPRLRPGIEQSAYRLF